MNSEEKVSLIFAFKLTKPALERLAEQLVSYRMSSVLGKNMWRLSSTVGKLSELKRIICLLLKKTLSNISSVFMLLNPLEVVKYL